MVADEFGLAVLGDGRALQAAFYSPDWTIYSPVGTTRRSTLPFGKVFGPFSCAVLMFLKTVIFTFFLNFNAHKTDSMHSCRRSQSRKTPGSRPRLERHVRARGVKSSR